MIRPPPISTRTDTLFPYTSLFRSAHALRSNPTSYLEKLCIKIYDVKKDYAHLEKNFPYSQEENLIPDIRRFGEVRSRAVDAAVVANIGRLLRSASRSSVEIRKSVG